jgi:murein DD-endopeptidase MepM/ murein hydrolase activator NlpD
MEKFLYYPVRQPINQTNLFGANPAQYKPLGNNGHPGNDFEAPSGTPLLAPCDGEAFYCFDKNGGDGIYIRYTDGTNYCNVILWHMWPKGNTTYPFSIPTDGTITKVKAGQMLGYTDNSGAPIESTGPHLHLGVMITNSSWTALAPENGFMGCVDPAPFYNGLFAADISAIEAAVTTATNVVAQIVSSTDITPQQKSNYLQQIWNDIKGLFG